MAFYFALLNVSARKEEKQPRHRRRRHSIASVESPLLDYRLLPRPQVVGKELYKDENGHVEQQQQHRQEESTTTTSTSTTTNKKKNKNRSSTRMKKSESTHANYKKIDKDRDRPYDLDAPSCSRCCDVYQNNNVEQRARRDKSSEASTSWRGDMVVNLKDDLTPTDKPSCLISSFPSNSKDHSPRGRNERRRGRGGRPLVVKRRVSPSESTTSGSRRSSKESQPRRDSPASSVASSRDERNSIVSPSFSLLHASLKLSGLGISPKLSTEKVPQLKKVTFDTADASYIIGNSFLGDRAVLLRRSSGCETVLRSSANLYQRQQKVVVPRCGAEWLKLLEGKAVVRPEDRNKDAKVQNHTNIALENAEKRSCILRRHSTSDRSKVSLVLRNQGFTTAEQEKDLMTLSVDRSRAY